MTPKAIDTLLALVERRGQVVSKDQIRAAVWGAGVHVEPNSVERQISDVRKGLGDGQDGQRYIETVPKRGYRFLAAVEELWEDVAPSAGPEPVAIPATPDVETAASGPSPAVSWRLRWRFNNKVAIALILILAAVAAGVAMIWRPGVSKAVGVRMRRSIAVMDFRNQSNAPESAWLSTALPEMIRTELARGKELRTVSGEEVARMKIELALPKVDSLSADTLSRIRKATGADLVLLGSFALLPGTAAGQVRIDVKVQDTITGETVASASRSGTSAGLLDLVPLAATELRNELGLPSLSPAESNAWRASVPADTEAQRLYYDGLAKLRLMDAQPAKELLTRAVALEPGSALIHAALAEAWATLGYQATARTEAHKAMDLSDSLTQEEKLGIEARYRTFSAEWARAVEIYKSLTMVFPDQPDYALRLAEAEMAAGRGGDAFQIIAQLRRLPSLLADDPRIDLAEAAISESVGDFRKEQAAATTAAEKAERMGARLLLANALLRDCWASNNLSARDRALGAARRAKDTFAAVGDPGGEARALKNIGDVLDDQGDHAQGRQYYEAALDIFKRIGHEGGVAVTLNNLAYAIRSQGDLKGARRRFEDSLEVSRKIADEGGLARALNGIAIIAWRQGNLAEAESLYQEALAKHRKRGDKSRAATVQGNLAIVQQDRGRLSDAKQNFEESLKLLRDIGDKVGVARTSGNLGELLIRQGDLPGAKTRFLEQFAIGKEIPDDKQRGYALQGLGAALLAEGDLAGARAKLEEAIALRMRTNESGLAAESRAELAAVAFEEGKPAEAAALSSEAADEFHREKEADQEISARALYARCLAAQGKVADASRISSSLVKGLQEVEDVALRSSALISVANVSAASGNTSQATRQLQQVYDESARGAYQLTQLEARLALAELDKSAKGRAELEAIEKESRSRQFGLIARKAAAAQANLR